MSGARLAACAVALALASCGQRQATSPAVAVEPPGYLGPRIELASPARGARLQGGEGALEVSGQACDEAHALTRLRVAGQDVPLAGPGPCHAFRLQVALPQGMAVLEGEAENEAGQRGSLAQALLRSSAWFERDGAGAVAPAALVVQLGPGLLDDGDRLVADDLATLSERALQALDLDAAVGPARLADPDRDGDGRLDTHRYDCLLYTTTHPLTGYEAWKSGPATRGAVVVERLALAEGGLSLRLSVRDLRVPFSVTGSLDSGCLGHVQDTVSGEVRASALVLEAEARVGLPAPGQPEVSFAGASAVFQGFLVAIDLGPLDFVGLGSAIGDRIAAQVQGPAQAAIASAATALIQERLAAGLAALASRSLVFALPAELGGGELRLDARLDAVDFTAQRGLLASGIAVRAAAPRSGRDVGPGALRLGGAVPDASGLAASDVSLGLADDALQQLLDAAWRAGALDLSDLALPPTGDLPGGRLTLTPALPPVLVPRPDGSPFVDLAIGDLAFDLSLPSPAGEARIRGWLSAALPVERLEVGPGGLQVVFGADPTLWIQVDEVNWGDLPATRAMAADLLRRGLAAFLPGLLGQGIAVLPLPSADLAGLDPSLAGLSLRLESAQALRLGRYQFLTADLAAGP